MMKLKCIENTAIQHSSSFSSNKESENQHLDCGKLFSPTVSGPFNSPKLFKIIIIYPQNQTGSFQCSNLCNCLKSDTCNLSRQVHRLRCTLRLQRRTGETRAHTDTHTYSAICTTNPSIKIHGNIMYKWTHEKAKQLLHCRKMQVFIY